MKNTTLPEVHKSVSPSKGKVTTATERKQARARNLHRFDNLPPVQISMMLSPQANEALRMLAHKHDKSQKEIVEQLLIEAYTKMRS